VTGKNVRYAISPTLNYIQHTDPLLDEKKVDEKEEKIQGKSSHIPMERPLMHPLVLTDSDIQILKTYARCTLTFLSATVNNASCRVKVHTLPS